MISDTLISPRADNDIRKRLSSYKRRAVTPDFRDILRQRCRERVRARRGALFDHLRSMSDDDSVRCALSQFIEQDLRELQSTCSLQDKNDSDIMEIEPLSDLALTEEELWVLEEYEKNLIENIDAQVNLADVVACPLCRGGKLMAQLTGVVTCSQCSLMLPYTMPLGCLETRIVNAAETHGKFCPEPPQFTICPDVNTSNLLVLCSSCGHCEVIV